LHNRALKRAHQLFAESIAVFSELDSEYGIWQGIVGHARIAVAAGKVAQAVRWCAAVDAWSTAQEMAPPLWTPEQRHCYERALAAARPALEPAAFQAAWDAGRALSLEKAVAEAIELG